MGRRSTRRHAHNNKNMKQGKFRCQFIWNVFNNDWLPAEGCDAVTANIEYPVFYQLPYRVLSRQKKCIYSANECWGKRSSNETEIVASGTMDPLVV